MTSLTPRAHPRVWRRLVTGLLGVAAILVCLLAMNHGSVSEVSGSGTTAAAAQGAQSAEQVVPALDRDVTPPAGERCGVACAPHQAVTAACILLLLVTMLVLAASLNLTRRTLLRQVLGALAARATALAPPAPPSLYLLSISRT